MSLSFGITIVELKGVCFTGWIDQVKGIVAQGNSKEEVMEELHKLLKIKIQLRLGMQKSKEILHSSPPVMAPLMNNNVTTDSINLSFA